MTIRAPWPDDVGETQFGGVSGLVQPVELGHVVTASEAAMLIRQVDPMDAEAQPLGGYGERDV